MRESGEPDDLRLADRIALQELKARYFRLMDTKQPDKWRELFTDDLVFYHDEDSVVPTDVEPTAVGGDAFVAMVTAVLEHVVTVHHGHMPEITFTGENEARGVWAMFDWLHDVRSGSSSQGFGHYYERYVRGTDGSWRIAELRLTRIRVDEFAAPAPRDQRPWPPPWQPPNV